jgi:hypothetical protein
MQRRGWVGDYKCRFCDDLETIHHLFFDGPWSTVSRTLGVSNGPGNFSQYFAWIAKVLPGRTNLHLVGVSALGFMEIEKPCLF